MSAPPWPAGRIRSLSKPGLRRLALLALVQLLASCAFQPQSAIRKLCSDCQQRPLDTGEFTLQTYSRNLADPQPYPFVHVYLEGDGQPLRRGRWPPWRQVYRPTVNPSSQRLTALHLMMLDPQPSVYLNRPCYGLDEMPANCTENLWTRGRYSETVSNAMQTALNQMAQRFPGKRWLLIGHSGGGSLAMLVAQGRGDVAGVITLAANLDTESWTRHFGYVSLLDQSLNPATMALLGDGILRWHYAASQDLHVPPALVASAARLDGQARFILLEGDHICCWRQHWPHIPQEMAAQLTAGMGQPIDTK